MRKLILEFAANDFGELINEPSIEKIELMEIVTWLREDSQEAAFICKAKFKDPKTTMADLFAGGEFKAFKAQLLEQDKAGISTYFVRTKPDASSSQVLGPGAYLSLPYEIRDGRVKITLLANPKAIRHLMQLVKKTGVSFKITSLTDAKFPSNSPLTRLTEKQRKVLLTAYNLGYYERPGRISSEELARKLKIRSSTLVIHRRKAERRLIEETLKQT